MNNYYTNYITSPEWFSLRRKVFDKYGKYCRRCKSSRRLHVHHKTYERLGKECIETDLVVLCKSCHDKYHKKNKHTSIETTDIFVENKKENKVFALKEKKLKKQKEVKLIYKPNKERQQKVKELQNLLGCKKIEKWEYFEMLRKL